MFNLFRFCNEVLAPPVDQDGRCGGGKRIDTMYSWIQRLVRAFLD